MVNTLVIDYSAKIRCRRPTVALTDGHWRAEK